MIWRKKVKMKKTVKKKNEKRMISNHIIIDSIKNNNDNVKFIDYTHQLEKDLCKLV
jgi:hypothetical protein